MEAALLSFFFVVSLSSMKHIIRKKPAWYTEAFILCDRRPVEDNATEGIPARKPYDPEAKQELVPTFQLRLRPNPSEGGFVFMFSQQTKL